MVLSLRVLLQTTHYKVNGAGVEWCSLLVRQGCTQLVLGVVFLRGLRPSGLPSTPPQAPSGPMAVPSLPHFGAAPEGYEKQLPGPTAAYSGTVYSCPVQ